VSFDIITSEYGASIGGFVEVEYPSEVLISHSVDIYSSPGVFTVEATRSRDDGKGQDRHFAQVDGLELVECRTTPDLLAAIERCVVWLQELKPLAE
jgi:hypothetical protein